MNAANYITVARVRAALHALYRTDAQIDAKQIVQRVFQDQLVPRDGRGRWRASRLLLIVLASLSATIGVFLYFSTR